MRRRLACFRFSSLAASIAVAVFPTIATAQIQVDGFAPGAVAPGQATEVALRGKRLNEAIRMWSGFPSTSEALPLEATTPDEVRKIKVTVPADVSVGIYPVAFIGADSGSATEPLLMMVDDLPSAPEVATNHTIATPQELTVPSGVDCASDGAVPDYFRFTGKQGQRVAIELVGARFGSDLDLLLTIFDAAGAELTSVDDDGVTRGDPRVAFVLPADGAYTLEVKDSRYRGGRYRLRIGDFPLVKSIVPLGGHAGRPGIFRVGVDASATAIPRAVRLPERVGETTPISVRLPGGVSSGWGMVRAADLAEAIEVAGDAPTPWVAPGAANGLFEAAGDRDEFELSLSKGERFLLRGLGRSLGSPAIPLLRIVNAAGAKLAESVIADNEEDTALDFTAPDVGVYKLQVEDLLGRGGADMAYRVEATATAVGFGLTIKNEAISNRTLHALGAGEGAWTIDVVAARRGYNGPIALSVESSRKGWKVFNEVIGEAKPETKLYLVAPDDLAKGEYAEFRIVGKATIDGREQTVAASNAIQIKAGRPQWAAPPSWLDGRMAVVGVGPAIKLYDATPAAPAFLFAQKQGIGKASVTYERVEPNFKDPPLTVVPLSVPAGMTVAAVNRVGAGPKETYDVVLNGPDSLPEGAHPIRLLAYASNGAIGQARIVTATVTIGAPLTVALAPPGTIAAGQKRQLKATIARAGVDAQVVELRIKQLPPGVTAPEVVTLAADQTEATIELTAAADAAPVKFETLVVTATSKYMDKPVALESAAAVLEVVKP